MNKKSEVKNQRSIKEKRKITSDNLSVPKEDRSKDVRGIKLNAETAKTAIILSEIIGPPKSRRRRGR